MAFTPKIVDRTDSALGLTSLQWSWTNVIGFFDVLHDFTKEIHVGHLCIDLLINNLNWAIQYPFSWHI